MFKIQICTGKLCQSKCKCLVNSSRFQNLKQNGFVSSKLQGLGSRSVCPPQPVRPHNAVPRSGSRGRQRGRSAAAASGPGPPTTSRRSSRGPARREAVTVAPPRFERPWLLNFRGEPSEHLRTSCALLKCRGTPQRNASGEHGNRGFLRWCL